MSTTYSLGWVYSVSASLLLIQGMATAATAFTYQGRLSDGGLPANGAYDLRFALFDAASDGNQIG